MFIRVWKLFRLILSRGIIYSDVGSGYHSMVINFSPSLAKLVQVMAAAVLGSQIQRVFLHGGVKFLRNLFR